MAKTVSSPHTEKGANSANNSYRPPICKCEIPCDWWNARGPYLEGQDPNFQPGAKDVHDYDFDPEEFDRFDCMDWDHPRPWYWRCK